MFVTHDYHPAWKGKQIFRGNYNIRFLRPTGHQPIVVAAMIPSCVNFEHQPSVNTSLQVPETHGFHQKS